MSLNEARRFFAEELRSTAKLRSARLVEALATVPRERFLGPGPWKVASSSPGAQGWAGYELTEDSDPRRVYRDVSVALDPGRDLYSGSPSTVASWLDAAALAEGSRVFHLGCGLGYYSAVMAEVVGESGHITAVEINHDLASRARENLAGLPNVQVLEGDGVELDPGPCDVILVHAGVTHAQSHWLDCLQPHGRLLIPVTFGFPGSNLGKGALLKVTREGPVFAAQFLPMPVVIYSCSTGRDEERSRKLLDAFKQGGMNSVRSLRRERHAANATCWLHDDDFCLSSNPALE